MRSAKLTTLAIVYEGAVPADGLYAVAAMGGTPRDLGVALFESSQV